MIIKANDFIFIHLIKFSICVDSAKQYPHEARTQIKYLTWQSVGFTRQQCADVAILAGHNCDRHPSLVRYMKQNATVLPSKDCVCLGVVDIDLHHCLAQLLMTQDIVDLDL